MDGLAFSEFIAKNDVEFSADPISADELEAVQKEMGLAFGEQLKHYLVNYGYCVLGSAELYGINARQGLESDMVKQTRYLHEYFPLTDPLVAVENQGDGDYFLVDGNDRVFEFISEIDDALTDTGLDLFEYIVNRFEEEM